MDEKKLTDFKHRSERNHEKEQELLEQIRSSANEALPPDSLRPEEIEKKLSEIPRQNSVTKKKKSCYRFYKWAAAAAVLVFAMTALWQVNRLSRESRIPDGTQAEVQIQSEQIQETAADQALLSGSSASDRHSGTEGAAEAAGETESVSAAPASSLEFVSDYQEVYDAVYNAFYADTGAEYDLAASPNGTTLEIAADESSSSRSLGSLAAYGSSDYSSTNIQEQGVDEADLVKTDGAWIYILRADGTLAIVKADSQKPVLESMITLEGITQPQVHEFYLDGDSLTIIAGGQDASLTEEDGVYQVSSGAQTCLFTYDISNRENPVLTGSVTQDGSYETSRKTGDYIYLFTSYTPQIADTYEASALVPRANGKAVPADSVYLPENLTTQSYLVISSVDVKNPGEIQDTKALVSGTANFYVSTENIYISNQVWNSDTTSTELVKFHYEEGTITGTAAGIVKGYLNNSFSMNEYEGFLRLVSTYYDEEWNEYNALYILDETLTLTGAIENLAEGETIRSARFLGDTGYFVTFRQTDPLFSVDLSEPSNPVILGELKVTGFSSYLHFYGENTLLGLGYEADEETGITSGLKLSMFDISDPENVTEENRLILSGVTWCSSLDNYKSILIDPQKNIFGFFCDSRYLVFSYDETEGFKTELIYDFYQDRISQQSLSTESVMDETNSRGIYIGDTLYLAGPSCVIAFDIENGYEETGRLWLES